MYLYKIYFNTYTNYNDNKCIEVIEELNILFKHNNINLEGFTIIEGGGYYKGETEISYIFEYVEDLYHEDEDGNVCTLSDNDDTIKLISKLIKNYYNQKEVLTTKQKINIL